MNMTVKVFHDKLGLLAEIRVSDGTARLERLSPYSAIWLPEGVSQNDQWFDNWLKSRVFPYRDDETTDMELQARPSRNLQEDTGQEALGQTLHDFRGWLGRRTGMWTMNTEFVLHEGPDLPWRREKGPLGVSLRHAVGFRRGDGESLHDLSW